MSTYKREDYREDVIYSFYDYKGIKVQFSLDDYYLKDSYIESLFVRNLITKDELQLYIRDLGLFFLNYKNLDTYGIDDIYEEIKSIRLKHFSKELLSKYYFNSFEINKPVYKQGLWQEDIKNDLIKNKKTFLFLLYDSRLLFFLKEDLEKIKSINKKILLITGDGLYIPNKTQYEALNISYPCMSYNDFLKQDGEDRVLFTYGEEALFLCRDISLESMSLVLPESYYTKAMVGEFSNRLCLLYVPSCFDISKTVTLKEKTVLSFRQLVCLSKEYGKTVYDLPVDQLYIRYPQYFISMYDEGALVPQKDNTFPLKIECEKDEEDTLSLFDKNKDEEIKKLINSKNKGTQYFSYYFDNNYELKEIPWRPKEKQNGILVQGIKAKKIKNAYVIRNKQNLKAFASKQKDGSINVLSNFLFFQTERLVNRYNSLRANRKEEQIKFIEEHLDYMLEKNKDSHIEAFPLYNKACIGKKADGEFLFFNFSLQGGSMNIYADDNEEIKIHWNKEVVNPKKVNENSEVIIYTPYMTKGLSEDEKEIIVGEDRINLVIIQNRIICIRESNVLLPSIGVVVSLNKKLGNKILKDKKKNENGYYSIGNISFELHLDPPNGIDKEEWSKLEWAYGGGLSLINNEEAAFGSDISSSILENEGWLSPLSMQTQDTPIHTMASHPRTAIGTTKKGELFVLVFSGRSLISRGANYIEMIEIAKKIIPGIKMMINVDGGASSLLALTINQSFLEVSFPSSSATNVAGQARGIVSTFCIEI